MGKKIKRKNISLILLTTLFGITLSMNSTIHSHQEFYAYINDTLSRWFFNEINKKITILDFGCGDAFLTNYIQKSFQNAHVVGFDVDLAQLKKNEEEYPEISFIHSLNDTLPLEDSSVDILYSVNVFHHIVYQERDRYARELLRVLKPSGALVIFETNPYNWWARKIFHEEHPKNMAMINVSLLRSHFDDAHYTVKSFYLYPNFSHTIEHYLYYFPFGSLYAVIIKKK